MEESNFFFLRIYLFSFVTPKFFWKFKSAVINGPLGLGVWMNAKRADNERFYEAMKLRQSKLGEERVGALKKYRLTEIKQSIGNGGVFSPNTKKRQRDAMEQLTELIGSSSGCVESNDSARERDGREIFEQLFDPCGPNVDKQNLNLNNSPVFQTINKERAYMQLGRCVHVTLLEEQNC